MTYISYPQLVPWSACRQMDASVPFVRQSLYGGDDSCKATELHTLFVCRKPSELTGQRGEMQARFQVMVCITWIYSVLEPESVRSGG